VRVIESGQLQPSAPKTSRQEEARLRTKGRKKVHSSKKTNLISITKPLDADEEENFRFLQYGTNEHMVWAKCKVT
jgi:hypothetical protein